MSGRRTALLLVSGSLAFAVGLCEILLRLFGFAAPFLVQPDPSLGVRLRPNLFIHYRGEGGVDAWTNSEGFLDVDHSVKRSPNTLRIAVLGDSFTEAKQVAVDERFTSLLHRRLQGCSHGKTVEILNFGIDGFGTAQEYLLWKNEVARYHPDIVLLAFFLGNDFSDNSREISVNKDRPYFTRQGNDLRLDATFADSGKFRRAMTTWRFRKALYDHLRVAQLWAVGFPGLVRFFSKNPVAGISRTINGRSYQIAEDERGTYLLQSVLRPPSDRDWEDAWQVSELLLRKFHEDVTRHDAKFVVAMIGMASQVYPVPALRQLLASELGVPDLSYPNRRLLRFAEREGIPAIDLTDPMRKAAEARNQCLHGFDSRLPCLGHWNQEGHRIAAELLAENLCREPRVSGQSVSLNR